MSKFFSALAAMIVVGVALSADAAETAQSITFDDLRLEAENREDYRPELLTDEVKALDGKMVRIKGFMSPSFKADGITKFVLMGYQPRRFGREVPHDYVVVKLAEGKSTKFRIKPVVVEGQFKLEELKFDGKLLTTRLIEPS